MGEAQVVRESSYASSAARDDGTHEPTAGFGGEWVAQPLAFCSCERSKLGERLRDGHLKDSLGSGVGTCSVAKFAWPWLEKDGQQASDICIQAERSSLVE